MMNQERFNALEKLGLTKEEALEWVDILTQRERDSHKKCRIATNCIICYKDSNGKYSYHRYIDPFRIHEIYAFQFSPNWLITLRDETEKYADYRIVLDLYWKAENYDNYAKSEGWMIMTHDCLTEYKNAYKHFCESDDATILHENKVEIDDLYSSSDYWVCGEGTYMDKVFHFYQLCKTDGNVSGQDKRRGFIRLIKSVKDVVVTD